MALNEAQGLEIDADTARSRWTGERMDYGWSLGRLFHMRDMARAE